MTGDRYTIPKEFFTQDIGYVYFWVRLIDWEDGSDQFSTQRGEDLKINYNFIDDDTVYLSKY